MIFGFSVLYFLFLVFVSFLNMGQVRHILEWVDPSVKYAKREVDIVEVNKCLLALSCFDSYNIS